MPTPLRRLVLAVEKASRADQRAGAAFREVFKVGDVIAWRYGDHVRSAEILWVSDGPWQHARLKVRSPHGRAYFVNGSTVLMTLEHAETP